MTKTSDDAAKRQGHDDVNTKFSTRRSILGAATLGAATLATAPAIAHTATDQIQGDTDKDNTLAAVKPLRGKTAIVTGARANIGRGIAIGLAELGADILVHYHRTETREEAEETGRLCSEAGSQRIAYAEGDLGDEAVVKAVFDTAERAMGGSDILVNNAGLIIKKPLAALSREEYMRCFNINELGTFLCMREAANRLNNDGRIINIVTSLAPSLTPNYGPYAATKAANSQLVRTLSKEIGGPDRRITVNSIHPGPIDTPFFREPEPEGAIQYASGLANLKRLGRVSDVVPTVQFLTLPSSQWMTGESLFVNGGYTQG